MQTITRFFADHSKSTHSLAGAFIFFATLYSASDRVQKLVDFLFLGHPRLSALFSLAIVIAVTYKGSHSAIGIEKQAAALESTALKQSAQDAPQPKA